MSQTRQPIHVFPKITPQVWFWGVTVIIVILTVIASILLYYHGMRYKNRRAITLSRNYSTITKLRSNKYIIKVRVFYYSKSR